MKKMITLLSITGLVATANANPKNVVPDLLVCNAWLAKTSKLIPITYTGDEQESYSGSADRFSIRLYTVLENGKILVETHIDSAADDIYMNGGRVELDSKAVTKIVGGLNIAGHKDYGSTVSIECRLK
jgi:hypothetical protein